MSSYASESLLVSSVRAAVARGTARNAEKPPRVLIIGALGRCGRGAVDLCLAAGIPSAQVLQWDMAETAAGGPFGEITASDVFVNCIYLAAPIPPFVSPATLADPARRLRVVCDVSCDTTNPHNPLPIYTANSTFAQPTLPVPVTTEPPLTVISIDHLPSLLPREASEAFSTALLPSLMLLKERRSARVWTEAEELFREKVATLPPK